MELPQPQRPLGTEGKKPTHDFLSLYSNDSSFQHADPKSTQGFYLKTQDFLQPLERTEKITDKGEGSVDLSAGRTSVEHVLPGGIGTYSISHISTFNQGGGKPEKPFCIVPANGLEKKAEANKVNSNSSSYSGGAFTLWDESIALDKGILKDNLEERQPMRERRAMSVDLPFLANNCFSRTLGDYGAQLSPLPTCNVKVAQNNQGFMDIIKSVKGVPEDDEDEEEEYLDMNRDTKNEGSSQRGDTVLKVDGRSNDQKANTPRSKHSATEQRRRSKINDRFQILRELVPHSDQKRDKASFLLEVIEYVQVLQEKVQKYEASFQGWNDKMKMMAWKNSQGPGENSADHSRTKNNPGPGFIFPGKFDDNRTVTTPSLATNSRNPLECDNTRSVAPYKAKEHHSGLPTKAVSVPIPLQPSVYNPIPRSSLAQTEQRLVSDAENVATHPQPQFWSRPKPADQPIQRNALNEQEELAVEGGVISVSSLYSQGLLDTLTQALQNSGLDLSQANISVQIDLGKRTTSRPSTTTSRPSTTTSSAKDYEDPSCSNLAVAHSRAASSGGDSEQAYKRPKTERNS